jgi:TPR repeat protein
MAQYALGTCYYNGDGVTQDLPQAARLWQQAADQGDNDAQLHLGNCYAHGLGVPQDKAQAAQLYEQAANNGQARAQRYVVAEAWAQRLRRRR